MSTFTEKQQYWCEQLQRADSFDGSLADFARHQGIKAQTLYQWRSALRKREITQVASQTVFTEVAQSSFAAPGLVMYLGDAQLVFSVLPDPRWLGGLLAGE